MSTQPFNNPKRPSFLECAIERGGQGARQVESIQFYSGYAEPGYSDPESGVIALGNFNNITRYDCETRESVTICDLPSRIAKILEDRYAAELEWEDEWIACSDCNKLVRTQADSYSWKRSYVECDGEIVCHECVTKSESAIIEHLASLEGESSKALTLDIDPEKYGYVKILDDQENGLYGGQDADPSVIAKSLLEKEVTRFLFKIDSTGQFDLTFSCYVHEDEAKQANDGPIATKAAEDPATVLERGLRAAASQAGHPVAGKIKIATIHADSTATTRTLTPQEFIEGGAR